jgi:hypothetical protein
MNIAEENEMKYEPPVDMMYGRYQHGKKKKGIANRKSKTKKIQSKNQAPTGGIIGIGL